MFVPARNTHTHMHRQTHCKRVKHRFPQALPAICQFSYGSELTLAVAHIKCPVTYNSTQTLPLALCIDSNWTHIAVEGGKRNPTKIHTSTPPPRENKTSSLNPEMAHAATNEAIIITNAFAVLREEWRNDGREGGREGGREQVRVEARERAIEHGRQELGTAKLGNMILRLATQGPGYSGNRGQPHPPPGSQASRCCATASSRVSQNLQFTMEKSSLFKFS